MRKAASRVLMVSLAALLAGYGASAGTVHARQVEAPGVDQKLAALRSVKELPPLAPVAPIKHDAKKAEIGKRLFFDRRLSGDAAIACANCHAPEKGWAEGVDLGKAYPGTDHFRNAPTMVNAAAKKSWFHDGRIGTDLNDVTREVITEDYFMNMDMRLMQERVKQDPIYVKMFAAAGWGEPSNGKVRNAIPEFLKTLTSRNAPFDAGKLSAAAQRGRVVFEGKGHCIQCHNGPLASDGQAHNTGVPENPKIWNEPLRSVAFVAFTQFMGVENYMNLARDPGAHVRMHDADGRDMGTFMTPSLRELKYTAPYMHNGMLATLDEVVAFYDRGGGSDPNKDPILRPLGLSDGEKKDLVAFLEALSGDPLTGPEHVWDENPATPALEMPPLAYEAIADWRNVKN